MRSSWVLVCCGLLLFSLDASEDDIGLLQYQQSNITNNPLETILQLNKSASNEQRPNGSLLDSYESRPIDLQSVMPIEWVHVPKTGSSFEATLLFSTGVCSNLPKAEDVVALFHPQPEDYGKAPDCTFSSQKLRRSNASNSPVSNKTALQVDHPRLFCELPADWKCSEKAMDLSIARRAHAGIEFKPGFSSAKGRFMMFLRQPGQRLLSNFHFSMKVSKTIPTGTTIESYIEMDSGLYTKMLTRACDERGCRGEPAPTSAEVDEAKTRLKTGFSFIGITERWNLSICLFNKMFNQKCCSFQFENVNPTKGESSSKYDDALLKGFEDPYDTGLFEVATDIFEANLKKYKVDESSCESCYRKAGILSK